MIYASDKESIVEETTCDIAYPKLFDCPVCNRVTLSESTQEKDKEGKFKTVKYCFQCGNKFYKETQWKQKEE